MQKLKITIYSCVIVVNFPNIPFFLHFCYRLPKPIYRVKIGCYIRLAKQNRGQTASKLRAWCRRVVFPTGVPLLRSQACLRTEKRGSARPPAAKPFYGVAVAQGTFRVRLAPTRNPEPGAGSSKGMFRHFIKEEIPRRSSFVWYWLW